MPKRFTSIFNVVSSVIVALLFSFHGEAGLAQSTVFTYQGRLTDGGGPASGQYDLQFQIFAALSGGTALGTLEKDDVPVTNGIFSVQLDFDDGNFNNYAAQFLEIGVRPFNQTGAYTPLTPRQRITSTPYAIKSLNAGTADGLSGACVNCVTSGQIGSVSGSQVSGLIPVASVPPESTNYIQNQNALSQPANFKIGGIGTANVFRAETQYNLMGAHVLSSPGLGNLFAGGGAGQSNFFGSLNSFFGVNSGRSNDLGGSNSFFGFAAGVANTSGSSNSFFGDESGQSNDFGNNNSFFGQFSGAANTGGGFNSFFGQESGRSNYTGVANVFVGSGAGLNNAFGNNNTFLGTDSGSSNTLESNNTFIGNQANGAVGITNASSIGYQASVTRSNSLVLGSNVSVGIGTTAPQYTLHVVGQNVRVEGNSFPRFSLNFTDGVPDGKRWQNYAAPIALVFSALNDVEMAETKWLQVNRGTGTAISSVVFPSAGNVGIGTPSPDHTLTVNGTADKPGGGSWDVFSDERLKDIKGRFTPGLKAVMQLQPLRYEYKPDNALGLRSSGEHVGFGAQAVQKIIPEAVTKNDRGYLLVNNDPILWTMLNAIKEQQQQILALRREIARLKTRIAKTDRRLLFNGRIP